MRRRSLYWLFVWSTLGILILCSLGTWQLFRMAEKREYLTELDGRMAADPVPLRRALQRAREGGDTEFLKVSATGSFGNKDLYKLATFEGGPGWQVLTLFTSDDGIAVLVDRGVIAAAMRDRLPASATGSTKITAAVRQYGRGQGLFDAENDPASATWYWWDVPAMLGSLAIAPDVDVAPFILQALPDPSGANVPLPANLESGIPNNHLGYALTWFSLALCLAAIAGLVARREIARRQA